MDDAYLGGERAGGKAGQGSENKVPIVAAVSLNEAGHPIYAKISPLVGFSSVAAAGCIHQAVVTGGKHPNELPVFRWNNILLGNMKTSFSGFFHAFNFDKYTRRYLGGFCFRSNRHFALARITERIANAVC